MTPAARRSSSLAEGLMVKVRDKRNELLAGVSGWAGRQAAALGGGLLRRSSHFPGLFAVMSLDL